MTIQDALKEVIKSLPTSWPLHSFIATNPLWDRVIEPMDVVLDDLNQVLSVNGSLSLNEYHQFYRKGQIDRDVLDGVLTDFLKNKKLDKNLKPLLLQFLMNKTVQQKLIVLENKNLGEPKRCADILISNQINDHLQTDYVQWVRDECIRWLSAFFDLGQAPWRMPSKSNRLFAAWHELSMLENKRWARILGKIPNRSDLAINHLQKVLYIPEQVQKTYIHQIIFQLKGWCGFIKFLQQRPDNPFTKREGQLEDIVAMWLCYEYYLLDKFKDKLKNLSLFTEESDGIKHDEVLTFWNALHHKKDQLKHTQKLAQTLNLINIRLLWQGAWERSYHEKLLHQLSKTKKQPRKDTFRAQCIFCIDARSEGIRRHLEKKSYYETFGAAGFFGFAFKLERLKGKKSSLQCPALFEPEQILELHEENARHWTLSTLPGFIELIRRVKKHGVAPFALFEVFGMWLSVKLISKTFFPVTYERIVHYFMAKKSTYKVIQEKTNKGYTIVQAAQAAEGLLQSIGLTQNFAPQIVLCAHKSVNNNNPFQAALNCGACGGNAGTSNAIVAAEALNHPEVRIALKDRGIDIPKATEFIAMCHNTTTDTFEILSAQEGSDYQDLQADLSIAGKALAKERCKALPSYYSLESRAAHWAELIPEWGLANNYAIIIGPRRETKGINLKREVFLQSYDTSHDPDGTILESIFLGPVTVAHWINAQYYFSTTDPDVYGSGNKAIHNITAKLGVMEGNIGDLRFGLTQQSVRFRDELVHHPRRLLVVVYAKKSHVEAILKKHAVLRHLFQGGWARLVVKSVVS